ncbi:hypothetical protein XENOCAPTIV_015510 [Xenoophorus captivus]|uniref:Uncharacterized protein n=1 Tax=Xenoophorus captivus TaxID=1517983 RepID=A0ABV0RIT2_9TELE
MKISRLLHQECHSKLLWVCLNSAPNSLVRMARYVETPCRNHSWNGLMQNLRLRGCFRCISFSALHAHPLCWLLQ